MRYANVAPCSPAMPPSRATQCSPAFLFPCESARTLARDVLYRAFGDPCWLNRDEVTRLLGALATMDIAGGAAYDGLVGAASSSDRRTLLTRDRRAERTYRLFGVNYQFVD